MIKNIDRLWVVRPNLGSPLLLKPAELRRFTITVAYRKPYKEKEGKVEWPHKWPENIHALYLQLRRSSYFSIAFAGQHFPLKVYAVRDYFRHPRYKDNYAHLKHAITSAQQQYLNYFRWEVKVDVGLTTTQFNRLYTIAKKWPVLLNLYSKTNGWTNYHAVFIHENLEDSHNLTILHITDTHIAKRYDMVPRILCSVRNEAECERLKQRYNNPNENLRAFIQEANQRVKKGEKVIVVHTGDITDYYFDGYWNGGWVCGQGGQWDDRRERLKRRGLIKSTWESNIEWFIKIITGRDGRGEALQCPLFTVPGNHEYYANELLMFPLIGTTLPSLYERRGEYSAFGLSGDEAREYDFYEYPTSYGMRPLSERKVFKEVLERIRVRKKESPLERFFGSWFADLRDFDASKSFWLIKPKSWILSQYLCELNYDLDFEVKLGRCHLLFFNTGNDLFPNNKLELVYPSIKRNRDYVDGGPHCRGITARHLQTLHWALKNKEKKLVFIFTHAPLIQLQGAPDKREDGNIVHLYEGVLDYRNSSAVKNAKRFLAKYYKEIWDRYASSIAKIEKPAKRLEEAKKLINILEKELSSYLNPELCPKGCFKSGTRANLDFFCAEGWNNSQKLDLSLPEAFSEMAGKGAVELLLLLSLHKAKGISSLIERFLWQICRRPRRAHSTDKPVLVFSGHTHKTHEFRIAEAKRKEADFNFYIDEYSKRYFQKTENALMLVLRRGFLCENSPFLMTSDSLKASSRKDYPPRYREIAVRGESLASLQMRDVDVKNFKPKGPSGRLRPASPVSFEPGCELIVLRAHNGQYVCAEESGRKGLVANRNYCREWEIFELVHSGHNKIALKAYNGKFVRAVGGGGGKLIADKWWIKDHETFTFIKKAVNIRTGEYRVTLRTYNGKYVCAEGGGGRELIANRDWAREWETFKVIKAPVLSPRLISPGNGAVIRRFSTTLRWQPVAGAVEYLVEVAAKRGRSWLKSSSERVFQPVFKFGVRGKRVQALQYRWRVRAIGVERSSPWSDWWEVYLDLPGLKVAGERKTGVETLDGR